MSAAPSSFSTSSPSLALLALEPLRGMADYCHALLTPTPVPRGDGHPVIVFPGLGGGPLSTRPLRRFLNKSGYVSHDWGQGLNTGPHGDFDDWLDKLDAHLIDVHSAHGRSVSLIGWSLGGVYARELAKRSGKLVRQVITLGTPFADLTANNHASTAYRFLNGDTSQLTPKMQRRLRQCPPVPTTAMYSKTDGIVPWQACMETASAMSESVEASGASHLGLGTHPKVLRIVADRLAQREGRWRPMKTLN
ncbi:MAG: alpha/beta fold hydrolase [Comamonadaceae bacterium]|nr:MAG: alpha/beta fold hydrolase [Comamonadaceae bacterium]